VSNRKLHLSRDEIARAFTGPDGERWPPILSPAQLAALTGQSPSTIYEWMSKGRLDGAFRKRGKHVLIWRDRAIHTLYNGPEWTS
jgi:predicted DNA-binding transcriptional regulator AlpA